MSLSEILLLHLLQVRYTFEVESAIKFLYLKKFCPCCHKLWIKLVSAYTKSPLDQLKVDQLNKQNKSTIAQMEVRQHYNIVNFALSKIMIFLNYFVDVVKVQSRR